MDLRIGPHSSSPGQAAPAAAEQKNRRLDQAATDFEGLLISQMLRHARQSGDGGWLGTGEDKSNETMTEMAEESLARMMASQGCLGLASMMKQGVLNEAKPKQPSAPRTEGPAAAP
jgi:Rod binding domain-containing protein